MSGRTKGFNSAGDLIKQIIDASTDNNSSPEEVMRATTNILISNVRAFAAHGELREIR
jgi:hypothetical protein